MDDQQERGGRRERERPDESALQSNKTATTNITDFPIHRTAPIPIPGATKQNSKRKKYNFRILSPLPPSPPEREPGYPTFAVKEFPEVTYEHATGSTSFTSAPRSERYHANVTSSAPPKQDKHTPSTSDPGPKSTSCNRNHQPSTFCPHTHRQLASFTPTAEQLDDLINEGRRRAEELNWATFTARSLGFNPELPDWARSRPPSQSPRGTPSGGECKQQVASPSTPFLTARIH